MIDGSGGDLFLEVDKDDEKGSSLFGIKIDGSEKFRITSDGEIRIDGPTSTTHGIRFTPNGWNGYQNRIGICGSSGADSWWSSNWNPTDGSRDSANYATNFIRHNVSTGYLSFGTGGVDESATERLRITSGGDATFSGAITSNGITQYLLPTMANGGQLGYDDGTKSLRFYANSSTGSSAKIQFHFNQSGTAAITFNQDSSANFGGDINLAEGKKTIFGSDSGNGAYIKHQSGHLEIKNETGWCYWDNVGSIRIRTGSSYGTALTISNSDQSATFGGTVSDPKGNLRDIPKNSQNAQVTIGTSHVGEVVATSSGGWDIPTGVMSPGNTVTLLNDHSGDLPITTNLTILYNTADGVRIENSTLNLGARGMATIYFWSANAAYIQASSLTVS